MQIDLEFGFVEPIRGLPEGVITLPRTASRSFPERHPCGLGGGSGPHDSLGDVQVQLDDGRTLTVLLWIDWMRADGPQVVVGGFLPDWSTPTVDVGPHVELGQHHMSLTLIEEDSVFAEQGIVAALVPDGIYTPEVPTGSSSIIDFDGCRLEITSSGIVN
ncbi:MAG: hypothetical protein P8J50_04625 [Acidimicrobiales bacterium]|nr:hypothetical protein [Acidimicrobiales bacterium]